MSKINDILNNMITLEEEQKVLTPTEIQQKASDFVKTIANFTKKLPEDKRAFFMVQLVDHFGGIHDNNVNGLFSDAVTKLYK